MSEESENENAVSSDHYVRKDATLDQQKLDEQEHEMQKLRERVEELEIEKVQSEIDIMELEQQVSSLQSLTTKKCDCSSVSSIEKEEKTKATSNTPSVEKCLEVIKAQEEVIKEKEEKIALLVGKIKDWGLDEEKIYEIPKKKKTKSVMKDTESIKKIKEEKKVNSEHSPTSKHNSEEEIPPVKRRSHGTKTEENKFDIIKRKRKRVSFYLEEDDEEGEPFYPRKTKPKEEKADLHEAFIAQHYEFDWAKIPSRPHDVTSSDKLRKVGRKFNTRRSLVPLLKNTFSSRTVSARIRDIHDDVEYKDDEEVETYFVYKKSPVVKIRKLKRMSLPNFKLDLD